MSGFGGYHRVMKCQGPGCRKRVASPRPQARYCSSGCRRNATLKRQHEKARLEKAEARKTAAAKRRESKTSSRKTLPKTTGPGETATDAPPVKDPGPVDPPEEHGLVKSTRAELEKLEAVDTINGQLALVLAGKVAESPSVAMVKDLRALIAEIKAESADPEPAAPEPAAEPDPDDDVTRARKVRDAKIRAAAG